MVGSQIAITNVLADLNLVVWYGIVMRIYASKKFWRILIWRLLRQSANPHGMAFMCGSGRPNNVSSI